LSSKKSTLVNFNRIFYLTFSICNKQVKIIRFSLLISPCCFAVIIELIYYTLFCGFGDLDHAFNLICSFIEVKIAIRQNQPFTIRINAGETIVFTVKDGKTLPA